MDIYASARKHGIGDIDIVHAVEHALAAGEQDDGKVLYLGPTAREIFSKSWPWSARTGPKW